MNKKRFIRIDFQVKMPLEDRYVILSQYRCIDETKSWLDNLNDAFGDACEHGADPNKRVQWEEVSEIDYMLEMFESIKGDIPNMFKCRAKYGQFLYGDVLDYMRDNFNDLYRSSSCDLFANLIIGEYVKKNRLL